MTSKQKWMAVFLCTIGLGGSSMLYAQQSGGIKRQVVQKADVSVPGHEAVVARVEVESGIAAGRHTHPGDEISYVLEGEGELLIDGEPPRKLKTGDAFIVPAGKIHDAKNTGNGPFKLVGTYIVEKGKPLATPAH